MTKKFKKKQTLLKWQKNTSKIWRWPKRKKENRKFKTIKIELVGVRNIGPDLEGQTDTWPHTLFKPGKYASEGQNLMHKVIYLHPCFHS